MLSVFPALSALNTPDRVGTHAILQCQLAFRYFAELRVNLPCRFDGQLCAESAPCIIGVRHWLKVIRIDASSITARVIQHQSWWNRTVDVFVIPPMRLEAATVTFQPAIDAARSVPIPATTLGIDCVSRRMRPLRRVATDVGEWLTSYMPHYPVCSSRDGCTFPASTSTKTGRIVYGVRERMIGPFFPWQGTTGTASLMIPIWPTATSEPMVKCFGRKGLIALEAMSRRLRWSHLDLHNRSRVAVPGAFQRCPASLYFTILMGIFGALRLRAVIAELRQAFGLKGRRHD